MDKKHLVFRYRDSIQMNGEGILPDDLNRFEEFIRDLADEVTQFTGFALGHDYSFYIDYDQTLNVDTQKDEVYTKVVEYIESKYLVEFKVAA